MNASLLVASAIAASIALPMVANAGPAPVPAGYKFEKCYGVAAAGKNDCQTATHSCAGESAQAGEGMSWVYVPMGTCEKLAGGSLAAK